MYDYEASTYDAADSSDTFSVLDPATPLPNFSFGVDLDHHARRHPMGFTTSPVCRPRDPACIGDPDQSMHDTDYQSASELMLEEMLRVHRASGASNLSI